MRTSIKKFNEDYQLKKLSTAIPHAATAMQYVNSTTFNLYFGAKDILYTQVNGKTYFQRLIFDYQILYNWLFNVGF
jgi:hypothetical protein